MGVTIGGDATKSGKNTHLLVVMRVSLSARLDESESILKTERAIKYVRTVCAISGEYV